MALSEIHSATPYKGVENGFLMELTDVFMVTVISVTFKR